jgi:hypothetical protein
MYAVTTPVVGLMSAIGGTLLTQVPPAEVLLSVDVKPTHAESVPVIGAGFGLIVATAVVRQPDANE